MDEREAALERAHEHAVRWLASLADRPVPAQASVDDVIARLGTELPDGPSSPSEVIDLLAEACEPGLPAIPSGRFYGFVMGGSHPAALAADWLTSAWDQNAGMRDVTTAYSAVEDVASSWLLDLLGLPAGSGVGYATGATMANFTCLATARDELLRRVELGRRPGRADRSAEGAGDRRRGAARQSRPGAALPGPRCTRGRRRRRSGPPGPGGSGHGSRERLGRPHDRAAPGRQRALRQLRSLRGGDRGGPPARRVGARGRRLRALRRGDHCTPAPDRRVRGRRLLGHRRPQDAERALRLRNRDRRGRRCTT